MTTIGQALRDVRVERSWSQERLGLAVGVSQPTISGWECGHHDISRSDLVAVLDALQVPEKCWARMLRLPVNEELRLGVGARRAV